MKLFAATAFLASLVSTAYAGPVQDFGLGEGNTFLYDTDSNQFTLTFVGGAVTQNQQDFKYIFFGPDCESIKYDDESAIGIENAVFGNLDNAIGAATVPTMTFNIDMTDIKDNDDLFTDNGSESTIIFCVRNSVWTLPDDNDQSQIEVNFQESVITIGVDLTANVVTSTIIAKRAKNTDDSAQETYTIATRTCQNTADPLKQGDLITVCMMPSSEDVVINSLLDFQWKQVSVAEQLWADGDVMVAEVSRTQDAVGPTADTASNPLSSDPDCDTVQPTAGAECSFSSILKADFYLDTSLNVEGSGKATFALNRRRLNAGNNDEAEARLLQGLEGDVTVAVALENTDTGPGALKTAGGASFGTALASGVALLGAALLA